MSVLITEPVHPACDLAEIIHTTVYTRRSYEEIRCPDDRARACFFLPLFFLGGESGVESSTTVSRSRVVHQV